MFCLTLAPIAISFGAEIDRPNDTAYTRLLQIFSITDKDFHMVDLYPHGQGLRAGVSYKGTTSEGFPCAFRIGFAPDFLVAVAFSRG